MTRKHIIISAAVLGLTISFSRPVFALDVPTAPSRTAILDQAKVIDDAAEAQLSQKLIDYKAKTGNEIAVLTIQSLQGEDNFEYSHRVAQAWGIGSSQANNGALLFVAVEDHKDYIQVGRGLEPYLTDLQSSLILSQKVNPEFKKGNYTAGITAGVESMISVIGGERLSEPKKTTKSSSAIEFFVYAGFFVVAYLLSFLARSKSWWAGGVFGALPGVILFFTATALLASVVFSLGLLFGLLLDYLLSKNYRARAASGDNTGFWGSGGGFFGGSGGFGSGSGGGFGGFSGGSFGGGGSGGSW
ncbi:TPM domain-containing protein [Candidatus Saccharibacteria bacterium]|nr:MAG: TPM domain-containing protein [Candidatus Saccharibacteria bacterium]